MSLAAISQSARTQQIGGLPHPRLLTSHEPSLNPDSCNSIDGMCCSTHAGSVMCNWEQTVCMLPSIQCQSSCSHKRLCPSLSHRHLCHRLCYDRRLLFHHTMKILLLQRIALLRCNLLLRHCLISLLVPSTKSHTDSYANGP